MPAELPPDRAYASTREVSRVLGVSAKTLQSWRVRGTGPRYVKFEGVVRYIRADLDQWILDHHGGGPEHGDVLPEGAAADISITVSIPVTHVPEYATTKWCAETFGISRSAVLSAIAHGNVPAVRDGKEWLIRPSDAALMWGWRLNRSVNDEGEPT